MFDEIPHPDEVCYSSLIVGLARNNLAEQSLSTFRAMRNSGVPSNMYAVSAALRASASSAALQQSYIVHAHSVVGGIDSCLIVATALVDSYGKCGVIEDARKVFDGFSATYCANVVTWNAMLSSYAQQGDLESSEELFQRMLEAGFEPDEHSFLAVLTACSNAGRANEAERWLNMMGSTYNMDPCVEHYTCLVGTLARAGRLKDAEHVALTMPYQPDKATWRALLSGCVAHGVGDMAWAVGQRILELDPRDDSTYVMLGNVCSMAGKKDDKAQMWTLMREQGVKKEGGRSWVELQGKIHVFVSGDRKHQQSNEIYAKLMELVEEVQKAGYRGTDERIWYHSEKLAVVFGILNGGTPQGVVLRVVKNLRICGDCHEFFKLLTKVLILELLVRDVSRYHRFKDGSCSCKDFW